MSDVFPLPLAPFEEYMLQDDRPGYRMTFLVEQSFAGEIDRTAFEAGVAEASRRHPLLRAFVQRRFLRRWQWTSADGVLPPVEWGALDQPVRFPDDPGIDLRLEVGVRFFVRVGEGRSRLISQFHHACCDGMGAIQFLSDLFAAYTRALFPTAEKPPAYQPVDEAHLSRRNDLRVHHDQTMPWRRLCLKTLGYCWKYGAHAPVSIAQSPSGETPLPYPGTLTKTLNASVQRKLRQVARRWDVTINELLVRELMLTIRDWNQRRTPLQEHDSISILVPTNLRNMDHDHMSAANVMSYVAFQRTAAELRQPQQTLESINEESRFYKRWRYGAAFLDGLRVLRWMPGLLRFILSRKRSLSTAILSCIGDPSLAITANFPVNEDGNPVLGNLVFDDLNTAPPIRPGSHAAFTTWHFSNKLRLGVRCDPQRFTLESAQSLLDLFTDRVLQLAESQERARDEVRIAA